MSTRAPSRSTSCSREAKEKPGGKAAWLRHQRDRNAGTSAFVSTAATASPRRPSERTVTSDCLRRALSTSTSIGVVMSPDAVLSCDNRDPAPQGVREPNPALSCLEHLAGGAEPEPGEKAGEFRGFLLEPDVMSKPMTPGHRRPRLARIELPRMEVEHDRLTLVIVDTVDTAPDELERRQPEVAAAANRQV